MKSSNNLIKLVVAALVAALCCVATMVIQIPVPATGGYLNLGDAVVLLSGWLLGPVYGALAAGIGSMLADLFAGYVQYAPATFIVKALMAIIMWTVLYLVRNLSEKHFAISTAFTIIGGIVAEAMMVLGYFVFEAFILQYGMGAAAAIVPNMIQGAAGIIAGTLLIGLLTKTGIKERYLN